MTTERCCKCTLCQIMYATGRRAQNSFGAVVGGQIKKILRCETTFVDYNFDWSVAVDIQNKTKRQAGLLFEKLLSIPFKELRKIGDRMMRTALQRITI